MRDQTQCACRRPFLLVEDDRAGLTDQAQPLFDRCDGLLKCLDRHIRRLRRIETEGEQELLAPRAPG
jgi:hypothetical protein